MRGESLSSPQSSKTSEKTHEPRWPALLAVLAMSGLNLSLPQYLVVGPRWLLLVLVGALLVPTVISHRVGMHDVNRVFGTITVALLTLAMLTSLVLLVLALPTHREAPTDLLLSAGALWITNILVFATWYWRLDAGGPHGRDQRPGHTEGAFLFPQMTMKDPTWSPNFMDYLFLAFNTSTALSPTDTLVLSRWAKFLMMVQASISLMVIVLLAARAVNIL
jgi:uncharacterized membrane protein